ncbi:MAG: helix-turn-helix domain-containing protein [Leptospiraceae bacterium]
MEPIRTLAASWLFAGAIVCFVWAASGLLRKGRKAALSAYFVSACGIWLLGGYRMVAIPISPYHFFSLLPVPVIYSIGPAIYIWVRQNLSETTRGFWIHWSWPAAGSILALILFLRGPSAPESPELLWIIFFGSKAITMGYLLAVISRLSWIADNEMRTRYSGLICLCAIAFIALMLGLAGSIPGWEILRLLSALSLPALVISGFLFGLIHPGLIHSLKEDFQVRYARSRLLHLDLDAIEDRLLQFMESERPYLDEDFNLSALARELDLSTHQISEILNSRLQCNFSDFINGYRIRAALQMLREERDRSVLSIGLAVGFNSRSSFHRSFKKQTGKTPQAYRESLAESLQD